MGKIGIFDSGFGGLSILKEIVALMPQYDYIYLGDSARAPYGDKPQEVIYEYTKQGIDFLFASGAEIIVLACNTSSSEALRKIQQEYLPLKHPGKRVLGVIIPACEQASKLSKNRGIGVLGTEATVASRAFRSELLKLDPSIAVYEVAAPRLVPLIESGEEEGEEMKRQIDEYVAMFPDGIDIMILGCTHYGFIAKQIKLKLPKVFVITEGSIVAMKLKDYFERHKDIESRLSGDSKIEFYTTGSTEAFDSHGSRFFGHDISSLKAHLS